MDADDLGPGPARRWFGAIGAPLACVALWLAPLPLGPEAHRLVGLFAAVLIAWVTEVVPVAVTALMIAPLMVVCGVTTPGSAFRYYADPLLYLFVGGFMLAAAMRRHGLDRRFARAMVSLPGVRGDAKRTVVAMLVAGALMSMWISNTATCAIMMPILLGLPGMERPQQRGATDPATGPLLAVAYVCSTAGLGTLLGTPPNLITVRLLETAGARIGFLEWLAIGLPSALLLSFAAGAICLARMGKLTSAPLATQEASPPWSRGEKVTAFAFGLAVFGWTFPPLMQLAGVSWARSLEALLHPGAVALLACAPLFFVQDAASSARPDAPRAPVLPWRDAVRIDWGVIVLFGGGISLGAQLEETGLAGAMAQAAVGATGATDLWMLCAIAAAATIVLSEFASNTAAANMLVPLVIALALELGLSPIPPALAVGMAASVGFMLPIATGPNALVYGSGRVPQLAMMRAGFWLDVLCFFLVMAILRVVCPLMGWV